MHNFTLRQSCGWHHEIFRVGFVVCFASSHLGRQFAVEDVARYLLQSYIFILALENVYHNVSLPLYNQGKSYICVAVMLIYVYVFSDFVCCFK